MSLPSDHGISNRVRSIASTRRDVVVRGTATALAATVVAATRGSSQQGHSPAAATPSGSDEPVPASESPLKLLFGMVPMDINDRDNSGPYWQYCDFARQFESLDLDQEAVVDDLVNQPFITFIDALAPGSDAYVHVMQEELISGIGFQPLDMDQNLVIGRLPEQVTIYRGAFDPEAVVSAWEASGFAPATTSSGIPAWTIGGNGEFDPNHPVQQYVTASHNNAAIHDDVIIFSQTLARLNRVLDHLETGGESLLDDPLMRPIIDSLPQTIVSACAMPPVTGFSGLDLTPKQLEVLKAEFDVVREESGPMPDMTALISAVDEGAMIPENREDILGTPVAGEFQNSGTMIVRIGTASSEDADQAARVVVARSAALRSALTGDLYSKYIEAQDAGSEGTTAMVSFSQLASPRFWFDMFARNDTLLFVPDSSLE